MLAIEYKHIKATCVAFRNVVDGKSKAVIKIGNELSFSRRHVHRSNYLDIYIHVQMIGSMVYSRASFGI